MRDGKELDFVYVGVYNACEGTDVFSAGGTFPDVNKDMDTFRSEFGRAGYDCYDFAIRARHNVASIPGCVAGSVHHCLISRNQ